MCAGHAISTAIERERRERHLADARALGAFLGLAESAAMIDGLPPQHFVNRLVEIAREYREKEATFAPIR